MSDLWHAVIHEKSHTNLWRTLIFLAFVNLTNLSRYSLADVSAVVGWSAEEGWSQESSSWCNNNFIFCRTGNRGFWRTRAEQNFLWQIKVMTLCLLVLLWTTPVTCPLWSVSLVCLSCGVVQKSQYIWYFRGAALCSEFWEMILKGRPTHLLLFQYQTHSTWLHFCVRIQGWSVKYIFFLELSASWDMTPTDMTNKAPELHLSSELGF